MIWPRCLKLRKRSLCSMTLTNLITKLLEKPSIVKLIKFMDLKTANTNLRCQWRREKKKFRSTKTSLSQKNRPLKRSVTRLQLSSKFEPKRLRILELSMRV